MFSARIDGHLNKQPCSAIASMHPLTGRGKGRACEVQKFFINGGNAGVALVVLADKWQCYSNAPVYLICSFICAVALPIGMKWTNNN